MRYLRHVRREPSERQPPRWGLIETFVAVQFLFGGLFLLPGAQSVRFLIRGLPYVFSGGMLLACFVKRVSVRDLPPGATLLMFAFVWLTVSLFHPASQFPAGVAQVVFQTCIAAPLFWVGAIVRDENRLRRMLIVMFAVNALSAGIGLLQLYYPDRLMPGEFSSLAESLNPDFMEALTYEGADGRQIVRPVGLSDMPGGAAIAGLNALLLGLALGVLSPGKKAARLIYYGGAVVGLVCLYLTKSRAMVIVALMAIAAMGALFAGLRQAVSIHIIGLGSGLVAGSFLLATMIGGDSVEQLFVDIAEEGVISTYRENRGFFLEDTVTNLLWEFPLGAGVGRWGMMQAYFGEDSGAWENRPIYVEIQLTGWLVDGGIVMWALYGGAIVLTMAYACRVAVSRAGGQVASLAAIVVCVELSIVGMAMAGPAFNTQLGIEFWMMAAALYGTAKGGGRERTELRAFRKSGPRSSMIIT